MRNFRLRLPAPALCAMRAHAERTPQLEVCGLLGLDAAGGVDVYPVANIAAEPRRSFHMQPQGQIAAMRSMEVRGQTLFGIYHSHPDAPALPSHTDVVQAAYAGVMYFIVSLRDEEIRAYHFDGESFRPVAVSAREGGENGTASGG